MRPLKDRFLDKCVPEPNTGCWLWTAGDDGSCGYGRIHVGSRDVGAHRVSYLIFVGPIPDDMCVCHRCDTPACVNPEHLFLGSRAENMADMATKKRSSRGPRHHRAMLTPEQVHEIRASTDTQWTLARRYGVGQTTISAVIRRRTWQ